MDEFIHNVEVLLADDETPEDVVTFLEFMRHKAVDPWGSLQFLRYLLSKERRQLRDPHLPTELDDFIKRRPELGRAFAIACGTGFLAMTYRSYVVGGFIRSL